MYWCELALALEPKMCYLKVTFYAHDKFMEISQNGPFDKFIMYVL